MYSLTETYADLQCGSALVSRAAISLRRGRQVGSDLGSPPLAASPAENKGTPT